jgi:hypothetical protein
MPIDSMVVAKNFFTSRLRRGSTVESQYGQVQLSTSGISMPNS